jgi:hypothetical protein
LTTLVTLLDDEATRDQAWAWLTAHFDALAPMLPDRYAGYLLLELPFCDAHKADELRDFFAPRVSSLTGGPRNLAHAVEATVSCAKLADAQRASATAFVRHGDQRGRAHGVVTTSQ